MKVRNAIPTFFYGLHFQDGIAEYKDMDDQPVIYINGDTAKGMDKSFQGKPVFVHHADGDPDLANVHGEADGLVIRSFYNKSDGNHWAEFVVYTEEGLSAITSGWKLSNAYAITHERGRGTWHGADYDREVAGAEYEHLAIVPNPRYQESIILTPDQFKAYNEENEAELLRIANSKGEHTMFKLFKKEAVKNSDDLTNMSVILPKSKVEKTITQLVNEADVLETKKDEKVVVNSTDLIEIDGKKITIAKFLKLHNEMKEELENEEDEDKKENEEDEDEMKNMDEDDAENMDEDKPENEDEDDLENEDEDDMENEDEDEMENEDEDDLENEDEEDEIKNKKKKNCKKKNSLSVAKEAHEKALRNYNKLKNAHNRTPKAVANIELGADKVARGSKRYGSN